MTSLPLGRSFSLGCGKTAGHPCRCYLGDWRSSSTPLQAYEPVETFPQDTTMSLGNSMYVFEAFKWHFGMIRNVNNCMGWSVAYNREEETFVVELHEEIQSFLPITRNSFQRLNVLSTMASYSTTLLPLVLLSCSLVWLLLWIFVHPLRKIPGPFWARRTSLWKVYHVYRRDLAFAIQKAHEKYGPVIRIGPNHVNFQTRDAIGPIYKAGSSMPKTKFYDAFTALHPNLFSTRDEEVRTLVSLDGT